MAVTRRPEEVVFLYHLALTWLAKVEITLSKVDQLELARRLEVDAASTSDDTASRLQDLADLVKSIAADRIF